MEDTDQVRALNGFREQIRSILDSSPQAMYVYLSEKLRFCNERFAEMLGYASADEWATTEGSFTHLFVDVQSHPVLVGAYQNAKRDAVGSTI